MAKIKLITTHPQIRALYHYGIKMSRDELMQAQEDIKEGRATLIKKIGDHTLIYETVTQGVKMLALFCIKKGCIKTFYKKSFLKQKKEKRKKLRDGRHYARQRGRRRPSKVEDFHAEI